jgi:hypothetical protein
MPLPRLIPLVVAALALLAAPAGAVVMAPAMDETPVAALAPGWNATAGWDAASPPLTQDKPAAADRFAPGASLPNAPSGDNLDAGAFDFAAPPDPDAPVEPSLTKFLAALFALAALARYPWRNLLRETYYPGSY